MSKRLPEESFDDYKVRCKAESKKAKHRRGWVRWVSAEANGPDDGIHSVSKSPVRGTYVKKLHGEIPKLRFKEEGEDEADG